MSVIAQPRTRRKPKFCGQPDAPGVTDCQVDCYGNFSPSVWQTGWVLGSNLLDQGQMEKSSVVSFNITWEVPELPTNPAFNTEVYLFPDLQTSNYILQPCLLFYGEPNQWIIQSVIFSYSSPPVYGAQYPVSVGELVQGQVQLYDGFWHVTTSSEASNHVSECRVSYAQAGPLMSGYGGLAWESYNLTDENIKQQLPQTSVMWFDIDVRLMGKPFTPSWQPWVSDCITNGCFPWFDIGQNITMLDSSTALMQFWQGQEASEKSKARMDKLAKNI